MPMLQLEKYFYPSISVKAYPDFKPEKKELAGALDVKTRVTSLSKEERKWEVSLKIKTLPNPDNRPFPYQVEFEVVGTFIVSPEFPEEDMEELVRVAGPSMLYSASREYLLMITSRAPYGGLSLPSISFQKKSKKVKQEKPNPKPAGEEVEKTP